MKNCSTCKIEKEFIMFRKHYNKLRSQCKDCEKIYSQKPEVKTRRNLYNQTPKRKTHLKSYSERPEVKARKKIYSKKPEIKARGKIYNKNYHNTPEVKVRMLAYSQTPEARIKQKFYRERPEIKAKAQTKEAKDYYLNYCKTFKIKIKEQKKKYNQRPEVRMAWNKYLKERKKNDINFKLAVVLRTRLNKAIKRNQKMGSAVKDLGCTVEFLKNYLESKFTNGMKWNNHGLWHIDHKKPLSKFNLENREEFLEACNYKNLQPLWEKDNLQKYNHYQLTPSVEEGLETLSIINN